MPDASNPYREPGAVSSQLAPLYTFDQGQFVVDLEKKIPPVCLKCAARDHVERRESRLAVGTGGQAVGALGGIVGAMIANVARNDPSLFLPLVLGALVLVAMIGLIAHYRTRRIDLALPLCSSCRAAWDDGERYRTGLLVGIALSVGLLIFGKWAEMSTAMIAGGGVFVLTLVVAIPLKLPKRFITAAREDGTRVFLVHVDPAVPSAIEARRVERAAKKATRSASADSSNTDDAAD